MAACNRTVLGTPRITLAGCQVLCNRCPSLREVKLFANVDIVLRGSVLHIPTSRSFDTLDSLNISLWSDVRPWKGNDEVTALLIHAMFPNLPAFLSYFGRVGEANNSRWASEVTFQWYQYQMQLRHGTSEVSADARALLDSRFLEYSEQSLREPWSSY